MSARDDILGAIRGRRLEESPHPPAYRIPPMTEELPVRFADRARASAAQVIILAGVAGIACTVADVLRARNLPAFIHLPPDPRLDIISWNESPGLSVLRDVPGADDVAMSVAPFAIAETGTLVYPASSHRPPSWHFRPGLEIALVAASDIHADLEDVLARIVRCGPLPSTINLVTGPSRTGDIEQTLELGAHGPKELIILIVPSLGGDQP